jgi:hypothetical protein
MLFTKGLRFNLIDADTDAETDNDNKTDTETDNITDSLRSLICCTSSSIFWVVIGSHKSEKFVEIWKLFWKLQFLQIRNNRFD